MKAAKYRLALVATLLVGWLLWLTYLALPSTTPREVLSHAQFLVSTLDVIAEVKSAEDGRADVHVVVAEVHWPTEAKDLAGQTLQVVNLADCQGWAGPGRYILPLVKYGGDYRVAAIPRSPGLDRLEARMPHIYAATELNLRQLATIPR